VFHILRVEKKECTTEVKTSMTLINGDTTWRNQEQGINIINTI
jgi:hypothetical protein